MRVDEQVDIELILDAADIECEAYHGDGLVPCSVTITHRVGSRCAGDDRKVCLNTARYAEEAISEPRSRCEDCMRLCRKCWWVVPV